MTTAKIKKIISALVALGLAVSATALAFTPSSTDFQVLNPVIDSGLKTSTSTSFGVGQSVGQTAIGKSTSTSFQLWSGFQYFFKANSNTLTATPGNSQASLSWTVPQTFLGIGIGSYEVGTGTSSGGETYQGVGNVTSFIKSGLTNGTPYFFKIRAKTASGLVLAYSNEATATPNGTTPPPPSGGGGGGLNGSAVEFSGLAYPGAQVSLLVAGQILATVPADGSGHFQISESPMLAGNYAFALSAKDTENRYSSLLPITLVLIDGQTSRADNILLPPTISTDKTQVKQGDPLIVSGSATPGAKVGIVVDGAVVQVLDIKADGKYTYNVNTTGLVFGQHFVKTNQSLGSQQSNFSYNNPFVVGSTNVGRPAGPCNNLTADFNNDCRVNLLDFSIMIYWFHKINFPGNIDLNRDGTVDLLDFSILMYQWTG